MNDLISRLSAATGPSRKLDGEISETVKWTRSYYYQEPPRYTESIDAALTLMPEGYGFMIRYHETAAGMRAICSLLGSNGDPDTWDVKAITPAIALVIACLKAKEESKP